MLSMVDGGKRLLNQISGNFQYGPQGEVRLVSHVFSARNKINSAQAVATVLTYTSKNELVTFDVTTSARRLSD